MRRLFLLLDEAADSLDFAEIRKARNLERLGGIQEYFSPRVVDDDFEDTQGPWSLVAVLLPGAQA
jgi:hypothetical protein